MKYVVTIARTYGSGGKEIGKLLAKESRNKILRS